MIATQIGTGLMRIRQQTVIARPALASMALLLCLTVSSLPALSTTAPSTLNNGPTFGLEGSPRSAMIDHRGSGRLRFDTAYRGSGRLSNSVAHRGSGRLTLELAYRGSGRLTQQTA